MSSLIFGSLPSAGAAEAVSMKFEIILFFLFIYAYVSH